MEDKKQTNSTEIGVNAKEKSPTTSAARRAQGAFFSGKNRSKTAGKCSGSCSGGSCK